MTNNRKLMEDVEAYRVDESYDMCEALKGIQEDGITIGMERGLERGLAKGREIGMETGIRGAVASMRECSIPDSVILQKLQDKFALTRQRAEEFLRENTEE